jgi:hypothetical protein
LILIDGMNWGWDEEEDNARSCSIMIMNTYKEVVVAELIVFVLYYMILYDDYDIYEMIMIYSMMKMEIGCLSWLYEFVSVSHQPFF